MNSSSSIKRVMAMVLGLLVVAVPFIGQFAPAAQARAAAADPAMEGVWSRTDLPVETGKANRTWMWGPEPFFNTYEAYAQGPGGQHLVSYYDKSRMEINNPAGDRNSQWFVTNGLLVNEMISGRIQTGNSSYQQSSPANIVVAGDNNSPNAPTYAALGGVSSVGADRRAPDRTGQSIREGMGRAGNIDSADSLSSYAKYGRYETTTGHNIADVFWNFLNQQGTVYQNGTYQNGQLVDWLFAMGYPVTEPYWINIQVSGQDRWVLMQAFQRRVLTYSPFNPDGWKVEMGNVGRHYYNWRYGGNGGIVPPTVTPAQPTATPTKAPVQAGISIDPSSGNGSTVVNVTGKGFPAYAAVTLSVVNGGAGYNSGMGTVAADGNGYFKVPITIPSDASRLGQVDVIATANGGAIQSKATFSFNFDPRLEVSGPTEVASGSTIRVIGNGFPSDRAVSIGLVFNGDVYWVGNAHSNRNGDFDVTVAIGQRSAGAQFKVVVVADGGVKATYRNTMTVIGQPTLQVAPAAGPAASWVAVQGHGWPVGRQISIGLRYAQRSDVSWTNVTAVVDGAGNFSTNVFIGPEYVNNDVRVVAQDGVSDLRAEGAYRATGPQQIATIAVNPNTLVAGQQATVTGANWPANANISIGVGRSGVEEWIAAGRADGNGNLNTVLTLGARWANAGQLLVTAVVANGPQATTTIVSVAGGAPRIVPMGLPMQITTSESGGAVVIKVKAEGWQPGQNVSVNVVSPDTTLNVPIIGVKVKNDGTFQLSFTPVAPWWGRTDLGVWAKADNGQQSVRFLPLVHAIKSDNNTYNVVGANWQANTGFQIRLRDNSGADVLLAQPISDPNGAFNVNVTLQRTPGDHRTITVVSPDGQYVSEFEI